MASGDYALAPDDPSLDITDAITIATWVRPEVAATQYLVKKAVNGATDGYELGLSSTAAGQQFFIRFNQTTSGNDFRINSVDTYALGQWSHVAATYDGAITRLYVDGDEVGSAAGPLSIASNDLSLGIGADSAGDSGLSGSMDDVRLYDRALSPSEIADLAAVNTAPLAADGSIFVLTDTPTDGIVAAIDGEADPLEFSIVDNGSLGSAVVNDSATGAFTYTPTTGATGEDSFTFKANDGEFDSNVATITVTIGTDDPSLVGHWEADEGSGTVLVDSSGAGNDAAVSGDTTWVPGVIGDAVSFDGTGDYALAPDDPSLDITDAITIATWVRPEAAATQYLVKKASLSASPGGYELALADDASAAGQKFFVRFNRNATGDTYRLNSVADYPLDTWSHVAATYDGSFIRIYVNGAEAAPALPASIAIESNDLALRISGDTGSTSYDLNGSMDDIRLYDRALNASEIADLASINFAPVAEDGVLLVEPDTVSAGILVANDANDDAMTFMIVDNGLLGTAAITDVDTGAFTYTPNAGVTGDDSFTFKANDGEFDSNVATVEVSIVAPEPPTIGHWMLDEGSGTTFIDSSPAGNDATTVGSPTWIAGQIGQAVEFDGTNDYATVADNDSLDITDAITMAYWVRPDKTATQYPFRKTNAYELSLNTSGYPFVRLNGSNTYRIDSVLTLYPADGETWMHMAATYDGSDVRLYVNGTEVPESPVAGPTSIAVNSNALGIGAEGAGASKYEGALDDVRLYDRALTPAEIADLATLDPPPDGPMFTVHRDMGHVWGNSWLPDTEITVMLGDPTSPDESFSVMTDEFGNFGPSEFVDVGFGHGLVPGDLVTVDDATSTKDVVVSDVAVVGVDPDTEVVTGTAGVDAPIQVWVHDDSGAFIDTVADGSGDWSVDFTSVGYDIVVGTQGGVAELDDDGDGTQTDWYVPNPMFTVHRESGDVFGNGWAGDTSVLVVLGDPTSPDESFSVMTDEFGNFGPSEFVDVGFGHGLVPGDLVTVDDATSTKDVVVSDVAVVEVDPDTEVVTGTAGVDAPIQVWVHDDSGAFIDTVADGSGDWSVDFTSVGYDIVVGTQGGVAELDDDGDGTQTDWYVPNPMFTVHRESGDVFGNGWAGDTSVLVVLGDPTSPDESFSVMTDEFGNFGPSEFVDRLGSGSGCRRVML